MPRKETIQLGFRLSPELVEGLKQRALDEELSVTKLLGRIIREYLELETDGKLQRSILRQFTSKKIEFDDGTAHWQVNFVPEVACGDGGFYMAFEIKANGTLELLDYVGE